MDRYKKKAIAFGSLEEKRNLRFIRKSVDRSNVRHKRLSELRNLEDSTLEELPDEKTPVKAVMQSEMSLCIQAKSGQGKLQSLGHQAPKEMTYREKLQKWKEEKELKKQLEARKRIPVFKVSRVNSERPPSSVRAVATSKNKETLKFVPKPAQPSRVAVKPPVNSRDVPKSVGNVPRPMQAVSSVSRSIANPKENLRTIPTTRNNSKQQPVSNPGTKTAVLSFRPLGNPGVKTPSAGNPGVKTSSAGNPGVKTSSAGNPGVKTSSACIPGVKTSSAGYPGAKTSSTVNCSTSRVVKPLSWNSSAAKQTPKPPGVTTTTAAGKIPSQRTGIASRIVPPRSCGKQGTTIPKPNASSDSGLKAPVQKKLPAPKGTRFDVEKKTKADEKDEFEGSNLADSICEEKSCEGKKRSSFAPDEFVFTAPDNLRKFAFPFGNSNLAAMYADMFGITLPRNATEDKSSAKAENVSAPEDKSSPKAENVSDPEDKSSSKIENVSAPENKPSLKAENESVPEDKPSSKAENVSVPEDKPLPNLSKVEGVSPPKDKTSSKIESEVQKEDSKVVECKSEVPKSELQSVSYAETKDSEVTADKTDDLSATGNTQKERKEKIKDMPLYRQLRTISENSPLPNDLDLEDSFSGEKTYKIRRSRRLASNHFATSSSLDPKYFEKTKLTSATGSDYLCPLPESPSESPLASKLSGLSVDSPSDTKYNFRARKPQKENRISLLGSPIRPHMGPRKSIKGDLICFTP